MQVNAVKQEAMQRVMHALDCARVEQMLENQG